MRLRLPFGWLSAALLLGILTGLILFFDAAAVSESNASWHADRSFADSMGRGGLALSALCGTAFFIILFVEIAFRRGWEPKGLRKLIPGVYVEKKFRTTTDLGFERRFILVRLSNGQQDEFECDPDEYEAVEAGDCVHLYHIGPYVESFLPVPAEAAEGIRLRAQRWKKDIDVIPYLRAYGSNPSAFRGWWTSIVAATISAFFLEQGLVMTITSEFFYRAKRSRYSTEYVEYVFREDYIRVIGIGVILVIGIIWMLLMRSVGNGVDIESGRDGDDWWNFRTRFPFF
ncbi:MAG: hypothetical protein KF824_04385 [Fimbriimonadaceae bacterium]|nr:MAG: hypothetical protein KF824_04385 [Fimbriimonadaceae bacterium]